MLWTRGDVSSNQLESAIFRGGGVDSYVHHGNGTTVHHCNRGICNNKARWFSFSVVAKAFPGGRLAHPEGQNEEENK